MNANRTQQHDIYLFGLHDSKHAIRLAIYFSLALPSKLQLNFALF